MPATDAAAPVPAPERRNRRRPGNAPAAPQANGNAVAVRRDNRGKIWSHVRQKWLDETPEEQVRQAYLCALVNEYGFSLEQIAEEEEVGVGRAQRVRADFVIWRTVQDRADGNNPLIVVECKSDNVTISEKDYWQGDSYARQTGARFLVTHNNRETKFWRVLHDRMPKTLEEIENVPHASDSDKAIAELLARLKVFKEDEFADLLHQCHNVIRNREHLDPAAAFDEIAKILFVKVTFERRLRAGSQRRNLFTAAFLDEQRKVYADPVKTLFEETKAEHERELIFDRGEQINLAFDTVREIVHRLERYDLSSTSEDIKGIAFERFLGKTFRGDIGQFFTPRPIVEFMVRMVEPKEGDVICDPASGSGGFLIRFFEIVREQILADADRQYQSFKAKAERNKRLSVAARAKCLREKYEEIQAGVAQGQDGSRLWALANRCIYGTDANDRMARTSKMNMIMHGDGHGGVHKHNGFLNVNGIFEGRFDIILTNPPFGASVEPTDIVREEDVTPGREEERRYSDLFGGLYREAQARMRAAAKAKKPIASLFELPARNGGKWGKVKTEILFIERCLSLLKPGGRMGIVLPEGVFNNPSLAYVRRFCEDRALVRAVVSLPQETFYSSGATVKASLLFMQKFTEAEQADYNRKRAAADKETRAKYAGEMEKDSARLQAEIEAAKDGKRQKEAQAARLQYQRDMEAKIQTESLALLKERFAYPVFLYDAERVGITATGEPDATELYEDPKLGLPADMKADATALALYRAFRPRPKAFLDSSAPTKAFAVWSKELERWSVLSFYKVGWKWPAAVIRPLSAALERRFDSVDRAKVRFADLQLVTLHFDGEMEPRNLDGKSGFKGKLFYAQAGDVVYSKIDVRNGAIGVVPLAMPTIAVSAEYPVYRVRPDVALPEYVKLLFRTGAFRRQINSMISGASGRKRVQPSDLEEIEVPLPPLPVQRAIIRPWQEAQAELEAARRKLTSASERLEAVILGARPVKGVHDPPACGVGKACARTVEAGD